jgi:hypothetical protein
MGEYNQGPTSNNPIALEQYNSMPTDSIRSGGFTIQNLITRQLDRIDFLMTLGTAKMDGGVSYMEEMQIINAVQRGLRSVESYLSPYLKDDAEYYDKVKVFKAMLSQPLQQGQELSAKTQSRFNLLAEWTDLLVSRFGNIDILPQKKLTVDFD